MTGSWKDAVSDGLAAFGALTQDGVLPKAAVQGVTTVADELGAHVPPSGDCLLAFPSTVVIPEVTATCLAVVLEDQLVVAWSAGTFRKKTGTVVLPRAGITDVTWGPGTTPKTHHATMLTVKHTGGTMQLAVPRKRTEIVAGVLRSALLTGAVTVPEESKVEYAPSGRPRHVEEGIQRWFAFRRGEISQAEALGGFRPMELLRWLTDEEKELEAGLLRDQKGR